MIARHELTAHFWTLAASVRATRAVRKTVVDRIMVIGGGLCLWGNEGKDAVNECMAVLRGREKTKCEGDFATGSTTTEKERKGQCRRNRPAGVHIGKAGTGQATATALAPRPGFPISERERF